MTESAAPPAVDGGTERHASWLTLFFDLTAVAASVHGVREERAGTFALACIPVRTPAGKAWGAARGVRGRSARWGWG
ncbi:hypothetical protein [Streptomyces sp. NBC_00096]|uniref:hypothetical protein n=1 Tax=Streptomyces sp. NBC_00096 TaxID=2975650 RepID=UPI0032554B0A